MEKTRYNLDIYKNSFYLSLYKVTVVHTSQYWFNAHLIVFIIFFYSQGDLTPELISGNELIKQEKLAIKNTQKTPAKMAGKNNLIFLS